jgi:hypothetical protein
MVLGMRALTRASFARVFGNAISQVIDRQKDPRRGGGLALHSCGSVGISRCRRCECPDSFALLVWAERHPQRAFNALSGKIDRIIDKPSLPDKT